MRSSVKVQALVALAIVGCSVKEITPTTKAGDGILVDNTQGKVSVDQARVPLVYSCDAGQVVSRTESGWACVSAGTGANAVLATIQTTAPLTGGGVLRAGGTLTLGITPTAASTTTAALTVFVRTDGSDTTCDGTVNAPATAAPACAFASPQKAVDSLPPIIMHAVTIALAAGTYSALPEHPSVLGIQKAFLSPTASITVGGLGAIMLSAVSPAVPYGVTISGGGVGPSGSHFVTLTNITVTGASEADIDVRGASAAFSGVVVQNSTKAGLRCDLQASCSATGMLTVTNNTRHGVEVSNGSTLNIEPSAIVAISSSGWAGLSVDGGSFLNSAGTLRTTGNGDTGMTISRHSSASFTGDTTVTSNQTEGIAVTTESDAVFEGDLTVTIPASHSAILAMKNASLSWNGNHSTTLTCTGWGSSAGLFVWQGSRADVVGAGPVSISGCEFGIWQAFHSSFSASGGSRSVSGSRVAAYIANLAYYQRGGFPASTSCVGGAVCE